MLNNKRICVVMPAYRAERTLERTYKEIPLDVVDDVICVDDASCDRSVEIAIGLGLHTVVHAENRGYGANQKTCYREALRRGADVVVMLHPDYQYSPKLITTLASLVTSEVYDVALGSRMLGDSARKGGMPLYKFISNILLTHAQNLVMGCRLSEYHTGYRAFSKEVLQSLPLEENDDDFVFDNQVLVQCVKFGYRISEVSCPTRYTPESSSIGFVRSCRYGLGVLKTAMLFRLHSMGLADPNFLSPEGKRLV